jgi:hypothetical protein
VVGPSGAIDRRSTTALNLVGAAQHLRRCAGSEAPKLVPRANKGLQLSSARLDLSTTWSVWHHASQNQSTTRAGLSQLKPDPLARWPKLFGVDADFG